MIVISNSLVLADTLPAGTTADNPVVGWHNLVTPATIEAGTEATANPAVNMGNPSTAEQWVGASATEQYVTVTPSVSDEVDYIGVARHNFGSAAIPVSVEVMASPGVPEVWTEIIAETVLADDSPVLFRFTKDSYAGVRLRLRAGTSAPSAAVVYLGALTVLERRIYVGHVPMPQGRNFKTMSGMSESGNFLGRVVLGSGTRTDIDMHNLTPSWVRATLLPFLRAAETVPFFFAWRPNSYPLETGYAWLSAPAVPVNERTNGMMSVSMRLAGIV